MPKAKITVIKKLNLKDLYGERPPAAIDESRITPECNRFDVGQEFVVDSHNCPPAFCNWAFAHPERPGACSLRRLLSLDERKGRCRLVLH